MAEQYSKKERAKAFGRKALLVGLLSVSLALDPSFQQNVWAIADAVDASMLRPAEAPAANSGLVTDERVGLGGMVYVCRGHVALIAGSKGPGLTTMVVDPAINSRGEIFSTTTEVALTEPKPLQSWYDVTTGERDSGRKFWCQLELFDGVVTKTVDGQTSIQSARSSSIAQKQAPSQLDLLHEAGAFSATVANLPENYLTPTLTQLHFQAQLRSA